jgi:short-subunit dehydrogenase
MSKQIIVTGASSGIGREIALLLAKPENELILAARSEDKLKSLNDECVACGASNVQHVVYDQCQFEKAARLREAVTGANDKELVLINNAGQAQFGPLTEFSAEQVVNQLNVNLVGMIEATRQLVQEMKSRGGGQVINLLSIASTNAFPGGTLYCAAKAGALAFSRALSAEVRKEGIKVSAVMPGATDTPLWDAMESHPPKEDMLPSKAVAEAVVDLVNMPKDRNVDELVLMPPKGFL